LRTPAACTLTPPINRAKTRSARDVFFWVRIEKNIEVVTVVFTEFSSKNIVGSAISSSHYFFLRSTKERSTLRNAGHFFSAKY
jgi:hypothetical protein